MVTRTFWKDTRSRIYWSGCVHFRRKRQIIATAKSARSWFFGKKLTQDKRSRGKLLAGPLSNVRNDDFRRATSHQAGFVRTFSKGMCYKTNEEVDDVYVNCIASCREYTFSRTYADSEAKLWIHKYTETGLVLNVQVVCQHNVCGIEIQISSTAGDNTNVRVVISRS